MQLETLQTLREQRIDGESLNETLSRLQQGGSLHTATEAPEAQESPAKLVSSCDPLPKLLASGEAA